MQTKTPITEVHASRLRPILKWAGGKEQELKHILPRLPEKFVNYYEPFVGGGAVYTAVEANRYFINDKSSELIALYRCLSGTHSKAFFRAIDEVIHNWDILTAVVENHEAFFVSTYALYSQGKITDDQTKSKLFAFIVEHSLEFNGMFTPTFNFNTTNFIRELQVNLVRKIKRMKHLEQKKGVRLPQNEVMDNVEASLKSAFYMHFRHIYNKADHYRLNEPVKSAIYLFIRNFTYSGMFRYNASGEFNVPYGGIGYNRKNLAKKIDYLRSKPLAERLSETTIECGDFEGFLNQHRPGAKDFMFLDPPYDSEFSTYAQNEFNQGDQKRLRDYLINDCKCRWMMVVKNTDLIAKLYSNSGLNIEAFDKTYLVSFMNRNDKECEHLLIRNY